MKNSIRALRSALLSTVTLIALLAMTLSTGKVSAQGLEPDKLAAVLNAINLLLFSERQKPIPQPTGLGVLLDLPQLSPDTYLVSDNLFAEFVLQTEGVEICFFIASSVALANGDLSVEINGEASQVALGENCYQLPRHQQRETNYVNLIVNTAGVTLTLSTLEMLAINQVQLALPRLTRGGWDERAVRKVIKIFAFGGHATDTQIIEWANMYPQDAIIEMLNFDQHNLKLSPLAAGESYPQTATQHGTLLGFQNFLSDANSNIPIPIESRSQYGINGYNFDDGFGRMITIRGLNPFRQRIGFWETNYHLATNLDASVSRHQMAIYYDEIMAAHESGVPYHEVMGVAAKSAAIAMQYGHRRNEWVFDHEMNQYVCECNEDFAREIHQLFYGIFGEGDPNHETGTIPETAKMLTDMSVNYISGLGYQLAVNFGTGDHHVADLTILGQTISGADASAKIDSLMPVSIQHPESLRNLPVMIISVLADDNLSMASANFLRQSWASMGSDKQFLDFIHAYAISTLFHSNQQFKYLTSHERALYMANKNNLENLEAFFGGGSYSGRAGRSVGGVINEDAAGEFFRPLHNVFGAQTSNEAAGSSLAFEKNYNALTDDEYRMRESVQCDSCDNGQPWQKKWSSVLPQRADGEYYVADVAQWLWNHVVGSLDNFTELEKAHLYSLLGSARINPGQTSDGDNPFDFNFLMCIVEDYQLKESANDAPLASILSGGTWDDYCRTNDDNVTGFTAAEQATLNRVYTGQAIADSPLAQDVLAQLGQFTLPFNATSGANNGANLREHALERVSNALGFIFTTPFVFAEGQ